MAGAEPRWTSAVVFADTVLPPVVFTTRASAKWLIVRAYSSRLVLRCYLRVYEKKNGLLFFSPSHLFSWPYSPAPSQWQFEPGVTCRALLPATVCALICLSRGRGSIRHFLPLVDWHRILPSLSPHFMAIPTQRHDTNLGPF